MSDDALINADHTIRSGSHVSVTNSHSDSPSPSSFPDFSTANGLRESIPITINPVALITTECIAITSAMRKNSRWAQSGVSAILGGGGRGPHNGVASRTLLASSASSQTTGAAGARSGTTAVNGNSSPSLANRWGLRGPKGKSMQDNPLMSAFAELRSNIARCKDITTFDAPSLLHPFLQVMRSSSASAPITSLAVTSVTEFFSYNLITSRSPRISLAMQQLSTAVKNCRFDVSDSAAEEIVLLRILKLMECMICGPQGRLLGDQSICELMDTLITICCQPRLSEVLRRSAEIAMISMCQVIFGRLKGLAIEPLPTRSRSNTVTGSQIPDEMKMMPSVDGEVVSSNTAASSTVDLSVTERDSSQSETPLEAPHTLPAAEVQTREVDEEDEEVKPYSLTSIQELFRALIDLLDPHNRKHTDAMRFMALRVLDVVFKVAGPSIADQPNLTKLANDDLCRHLFQLVRSENMLLLNGSLRVAGTLLSTCRRVLKLQQEMLLSYLIGCLHSRMDIPTEPGMDPSLYDGIGPPKLVKSLPAPSQPSSGRSTPVPVKDRQKLGLEGGARKPEARETMVESIGNLVRTPSYMAELFINYDCEVDREDLCEDMVMLLSRNALPDSAIWSTTNVPPLCLDSLLTHVQCVADRLTVQATVATPDLQRLREQRSRKKIIIQGAARFNEKPKAGIAYLVSHGIIDDPDDHEQVARFLKGTTRVSKQVLGDFLSKKPNEGILNAFIGLFRFDKMRIDEAFRQVVSTFRLPGESQLIERIVVAFTEKYCSENNSGEIADKDAAFVLTYGIIMLNTGLYNPNLKPKDRMTSEGFVKNLRGVNSGKDFAPEYLLEIYESIKQEEIIVPDEHDNKHAFDYAWRELLVKTTTAGDLTIYETNVFDADMFAATWKPIVATLYYVLMEATDDAVRSRVVDGFHQCAEIAAHYKLSEAFDRIVFVVSSISTLASETPFNTSLNTEVEVQDEVVTVSELAVRYGRDHKAQFATVLLFRVLHGQEDAVHDSWISIVRILRNLFVNSLIPFPGAEIDDTLQLPPIPLQLASQIVDREERTNDSGLFSAFTSYISSYAADDPPEPSHEELDSTLSAVDAIKACHLAPVLSNIFALPTECIQLLVAALLSQLPEETSPIVIVKAERPVSAPHRSEASRHTRTGPAYNPSTVYLLEFATILTLRDKATIAAAGESLTASLQTIVRDASNLHPLTSSRAVHYLLELLRLSFEHDFMRAPVVLHAISSFDDTTLDYTSAAIINGLAKCVAHAESLRQEITNSPDFWSIMQRMHQHKDEAEHVFALLEVIATCQPTAVTADNYEYTIGLANDFAKAASVISIQERRRDATARRGTKAPKQQARAQESPIVIRGAKAINIISHLTSRIPDLIEQSHLERNEAWTAYWTPVFDSLAGQCCNSSREIRHKALAALQRALLSDQLRDVERQQWTNIFGEVLFPLVLELLKPEVYRLDPAPAGMSETRVQAAGLLCKVFLRYLDELDKCAQLVQVWLRILEVLDRMMNSGMDGDEAVEAVPESLKNVLLVMAGAGYLHKPEEDGQDDDEEHDDEGAKMWLETKRRLHRFLPDLFEEVFPEEKDKVDRGKEHVPVASVEKKDDGGGEGEEIGSAADVLADEASPQQHQQQQ